MDQPSELAITRADAALTVPQSVIEIARSVDREIAVDLDSAERLARDELEELRHIERERGQRLHKGHALHSIGVALVPRDHVHARTYFHAALVEDVRTYPDGPPEGWGRARQVLVELYGQRLSALDELAGLARDTVSDPVALADAFEKDQGGDLGIYVGLRAASRNEADLDGVDATSLVFVAGTHAFPHHMTALRDAVADCGLTPVVVMEFKSRPDDDDYTKSERLMGRCGRAVFDLSYLQGQMLELPMAALVYRIPFFAGFIEGTVTGELHGTGMVRGLLDKASVKPESVIDTAQLKEAARAWLRRQGALATPPLARRDAITTDMLGAIGGTASPYGETIGSNTPFLPEDLPAVPSGEGYIRNVESSMANVDYWAERLRTTDRGAADTSDNSEIHEDDAADDMDDAPGL